MESIIIRPRKQNKRTFRIDLPSIANARNESRDYVINLMAGLSKSKSTAQSPVADKKKTLSVLSTVKMADAACQGSDV